MKDKKLLALLLLGGIGIYYLMNRPPVYAPLPRFGNQVAHSTISRECRRLAQLHRLLIRITRRRVAFTKFQNIKSFIRCKNYLLSC